MHKTFTIFSILFWSLSLNAQIFTEDLEQFDLEPNSFINGSDLLGGFEIAGGFLPNNFDTTFQSWTGWALSSMTDTTTEGFTNQYSAIAGSGADGSQNYAVSYHFIPNTFQLSGFIPDATIAIEGMQITNGTYPYLSMLNGDGFAKKFGGADGNDPDFFLLTIKGLDDTGALLDSVEFYLADYRFEDNSMDYIIKDWTYVDLSPLANSVELTFTLSSTDVGMFGVNTPTYFCIDNIDYDVLFTSTEEEIKADITIFPNPTTDLINIEIVSESNVEIYSTDGRLMSNFTLQKGQHALPVYELPNGLYTFIVSSKNGLASTNFVKN